MKRMDKSLHFSWTLYAIGLLVAGQVIMTAATIPKIRPTPNLIESDGYPIEVHHVKTADGFLIELHRIPAPMKKAESRTEESRVILMPHCFLCSSAVYVLLGPGKGLGYVLQESGYDVWMMNARGTTYSMNHTHLSPRDVEFWNFSFHEIAVEDLSSSLDYVLEVTGQKQVDLLGYSMGSTVMFIGLAQHPLFRSKVRKAVAMSPIAYLSGLKFGFANLVQLFMGNYHFRRSYREFPPRDWELNALFYTLCKKQHLKSRQETTICRELTGGVVGAKTTHTEVKNLDFFFLYIPDTTSTKLLNHYLQIRSSGSFCQYNYGFEGNMRRYGTWYPPRYNLSQIDVPVALFSSDWDTFSSRKDVDRLRSELPNVPIHHKVNLKDFSHADFIWGKNVHKELYTRIVDFLLN